MQKQTENIQNRKITNGAENAPMRSGQFNAKSCFFIDRGAWALNDLKAEDIIDYAEEMLSIAERTIQSQQERLAQLERLVTRDELTGIMNRRGFNEAVTAEFDRTERGASKGGVVVMIDLDDFKPINDTYGHLVGDECLKRVAQTLQNEIRLTDVVARLGGDEFVLLLTNTTLNEVADRIEDLAWQLNNIFLAWNGEEVPVRASFGVKAFGAGDNAEDIMNGADVALYEKKAQKPSSRTSLEGHSGEIQTVNQEIKGKAVLVA